MTGVQMNVKKLKKKKKKSFVTTLKKKCDQNHLRPKKRRTRFHDTDVEQYDTDFTQELTLRRQDCCLKNPNFAIICDFLINFGEYLKLPKISLKDLQLMIGAEGEVQKPLEDLHIILLRKLKLQKFNVYHKTWLKALGNYCATNRDLELEGIQLELQGYSDLKIHSRLEILKCLCESQLDNILCDSILEIHDLPDEELRQEPSGLDISGSTYWVQMSEEGDLRIYTEESSNPWSTVCQTRENLVELLGNLREEKMFKDEQKKMEDARREEEERKEAEQRDLIKELQEKENDKPKVADPVFNCNVCPLVFKTRLQILEHYSAIHLHRKLKEKFAHFVDGTVCKICKFDSAAKDEASDPKDDSKEKEDTEKEKKDGKESDTVGENIEDLIWIHIGTIHEKVCIVIKEEGLPEVPENLPKPIENKSCDETEKKTVDATDNDCDNEAKKQISEDANGCFNEKNTKIVLEKSGDSSSSSESSDSSKSGTSSLSQSFDTNTSDSGHFSITTSLEDDSSNSCDRRTRRSARLSKAVIPHEVVVHTKSQSTTQKKRERQQRRPTCKFCGFYETDDCNPMYTCTCKYAWHKLCIKPKLMARPNSSWRCPLCNHMSLVAMLQNVLTEFDALMERVEQRRLASLTENRNMSDIGDHHDEEDSTVANPEAGAEDNLQYDDGGDDKSDDDTSNREPHPPALTREERKANRNYYESGSEDEQEARDRDWARIRNTCLCKAKGYKKNDCQYCRRMKMSTSELLIETGEIRKRTGDAEMFVDKIATPKKKPKRPRTPKFPRRPKTPKQKPQKILSDGGDVIEVLDDDGSNSLPATNYQVPSVQYRQHDIPSYNQCQTNPRQTQGYPQQQLPTSAVFQHLTSVIEHSTQQQQPAVIQQQSPATEAVIQQPTAYTVQQDPHSQQPSAAHSPAAYSQPSPSAAYNQNSAATNQQPVAAVLSKIELVALDEDSDEDDDSMQLDQNSPAARYYPERVTKFSSPAPLPPTEPEQETELQPVAISTSTIPQDSPLARYYPDRVQQTQEPVTSVDDYDEHTVYDDAQQPITTQQPDQRFTTPVRTARTPQNTHHTPITGTPRSVRTLGVRNVTPNNQHRISQQGQASVRRRLAMPSPSRGGHASPVNSPRRMMSPAQNSGRFNSPRRIMSPAQNSGRFNSPRMMSPAQRRFASPSGSAGNPSPRGRFGTNTHSPPIRTAVSSPRLIQPQGAAVRRQLIPPSGRGRGVTTAATRGQNVARGRGQSVSRGRGQQQSQTTSLMSNYSRRLPNNTELIHMPGPQNSGQAVTSTFGTANQQLGGQAAVPANFGAADDNTSGTWNNPEEITLLDTEENNDDECLIYPADNGSIPADNSSSIAADNSSIPTERHWPGGANIASSSYQQEEITLDDEDEQNDVITLGDEGIEDDAASSNPSDGIIRPSAYASSNPGDGILRPSAYASSNPGNEILRSSAYASSNPGDGILRPSAYASSNLDDIAVPDIAESDQETEPPPVRYDDPDDHFNYIDTADYSNEDYSQYAEDVIIEEGVVINNRHGNTAIMAQQQENFDDGGTVVLGDEDDDEIQIL